MNSHLNIFKTYAKEGRLYQLENDLTRSFAICMQEDALFFHEVLKVLLGADEEVFDLIFSSPEIDNNIQIDIQVNSNSISGYEKIIAVSLSEFEMDETHFWESIDETEYDPICDIVVKINDIVIIIEAKRDNIDCTKQLYNQVYNIVKHSGFESDINNLVQPVDLNWSKLMKIITRVLSFQQTMGSVNRFTSDFVNLVRGHNPNWFPETPIIALKAENREGIYRRIASAINRLDIQNEYKKLEYNDRLGLVFTKPWAGEILFNISEEGDLYVTVYAGNTKSQGYFIFNEDLEISNQLIVRGIKRDIDKVYHIKLTSFQKYFTGLWFEENKLLDKALYSKENYWNYTGQNKRGEHWTAIESLFDKSFVKEYLWRNELSWEDKVLKSNRNRFDMSFGYELSISIPFEELRLVDDNSDSLEGLMGLIKECYQKFEQELIK